ncbi:hypothetical protein G5I_09178 [Acromyrmex echinatior]|uniref:Uncharacterized protein n=1 Tax=Acromyrmex echinatior TaxID=103372 RepID=F4WTI0_ACREC|nr:hypothetical protein G5I_09178 [Acromyrmex echinatior]
MTRVNQPSAGGSEFIIITRGSRDATHGKSAADDNVAATPANYIVDIKARRNDTTERTNKRMNERVRQADGQTDEWTNERRCKRTYVGRPGEQNASADLVAYLWLRYPVVNKVPHGRDIGVYLRAVGAPEAQRETRWLRKAAAAEAAPAAAADGGGAVQGRWSTTLLARRRPPGRAPLKKHSN